MDVAGAKQRVRERVWGRLEGEGAARFPGTRGRIPNFRGTEAAAERLASLPPWEAARAVKANPDAPQLPVRSRALADGKTLFVAVPRLRAERPFLALDPRRIGAPPRRAASISGAARHGRPTALDAVPHLDLVVCGSVAVNRRGARIGKGGGYADLELALLLETGSVDDDTLIVTTVHPVQLLDGALPQAGHDVPVDIIVMPDRTIRCRRRRRPAGILPAELDAAKAAAIPVLADRLRRAGPPPD
jgi:5-formyltetrahydrofolate cyclo-ligase